MKDQRTEAAIRDSNLAVVTNAVELASQVVQKIAGNDIANTINGKLVNSAFLQESVAAGIQANLTPTTGDR
jgi:hypothetical protein